MRTWRSSPVSLLRKAMGPPVTVTFSVRARCRRVRSSAWSSGRGLRGTQQREAVGIERVVQDAQHRWLQHRLQVDEDVAAGHEVDVREGGVLREVLRREDEQIANGAAHEVLGVVRAEEAVQTL